MPTALVTGIQGFTGRHLANELRSAGYRVIGTSRQAGCHGDREDVLTCDLSDRSAMTEMFRSIQPEVVIHLAGMAHVVQGDVDRLYHTHIVGTRNLLEALVHSGCQPRSVLLASSGHIYGNANVALIDETTTAAPASDYAVSKLAMEYMARLWLDRLPITLVRPFNYTGVGQSMNFLLPKLVHCFKNRLPVLELGNLDVVRDFSDVRSVVHCYRRLTESDKMAGEDFIICSGEGHSLTGVLQMMRDLSGHAPEIRINPAYVRSNDMRRLVGSRAKLERVVGSVHFIPLMETLRWMLDHH
ncbi:MAG: GDP-mannose 4,6-dehydratase [Magnetococcales bacterium]|nr:GDP-mannose 4,6-dehydratase [Magnetococcales bacterium]